VDARTATPLQETFDRRFIMRGLSLTACLLLWAVSLQAQAASPSDAHTRSWGPAPPVFPRGAQMAVISGDPAKAAPFTVELSLPDGYRLPPHFHPTDETVEVKQGTFLFGMGDSLDLTKAKAMEVGARGTVPAKVHHYAAARGATVVAVSAMGPFAMTYVHPADNPQTATRP
jgi:hypothetical protein